MTSSPRPHHPNQALKTNEPNAHNTDLDHQEQVLSYGKEDTLHWNQKQNYDIVLLLGQVNCLLLNLGFPFKICLNRIHWKNLMQHLLWIHKLRWQCWTDWTQRSLRHCSLMSSVHAFIWNKFISYNMLYRKTLPDLYCSGSMSCTCNRTKWLHREWSGSHRHWPSTPPCKYWWREACGAQHLHAVLPEFQKKLICALEFPMLLHFPV